MRRIFKSGSCDNEGQGVPDLWGGLQVDAGEGLTVFFLDGGG